LCGLADITSWETRPDEIDPINWRIIEEVYANVDDIDLFSGGLAERINVENGLVGETFGCILGLQFRDLMNGDRFFFTHASGPNAQGLPEKSKATVMLRTLGDILCENIEGLEEIQENVFLMADAKTNPSIGCSQRSGLDFNGIANDIINRVPLAVSGWCPWSEWSECSKTCGDGLHRRTRQCRCPSGDTDCYGEGIEDYPCNHGDCAYNPLSPHSATVSDHVQSPEAVVVSGWCPWSRWSYCSKTCGDGLQRRTRQCRCPEGDTECYGRSVEDYNCNHGNCRYTTPHPGY